MLLRIARNPRLGLPALAEASHMLAGISNIQFRRTPHRAAHLFTKPRGGRAASAVTTSRDFPEISIGSHHLAFSQGSQCVRR